MCIHGALHCDLLTVIVCGLFIIALFITFAVLLKTVLIVRG